MVQHKALRPGVSDNVSTERPRMNPSVSRIFGERLIGSLIKKYMNIRHTAQLKSTIWFNSRTCMSTSITNSNMYEIKLLSILSVDYSFVGPYIVDRVKFLLERILYHSDCAKCLEIGGKSDFKNQKSIVACLYFPHYGAYIYTLRKGS